MPRCTAALFAAVIAIGPFAATAQSPLGLWMTEKEGVIVKLFDCGGALCGQTVWLKKMNRKNGAPRLDAKNPDPALRDRHWCGITAITDVRPKSANEWTGGEVYDPKTGETFDFDIEVKGPDRLKVRGYLGLPLLGKSETWTRTDGAGVDFCA